MSISKHSLGSAWPRQRQLNVVVADTHLVAGKRARCGIASRARVAPELGGTSANQLKK